MIWLSMFCFFAACVGMRVAIEGQRVEQRLNLICGESKEPEISDADIEAWRRELDEEWEMRR